MNILFADNATTTLATSITSTDTSVTLASGTGVLFPNPTVGQEYFLLSLTDAATRTLNEIVQCTARSADVLTIVRAQEGTGARAWSAGDIAQNNWTAGSPFDLNLTQLVTNAGNPNGAVEGVLSELCIDTISNLLYLCTTAGTSVTAVWTLIGKPGSWSGVPADMTGNVTLTAANAGQLIIWDGNGTLLLPLTSAVPAGARIGVYKYAANSATFTPSGTDVLDPGGLVSITAITAVGMIIFNNEQQDGHWSIEGDLAIAFVCPSMSSYLRGLNITNQTSARSAGTNYTNGTERTLLVQITFGDTVASATCTGTLNIVSGSGIGGETANGGYNGVGIGTVFGVMAPGAVYSASVANMSILDWTEAY